MNANPHDLSAHPDLGPIGARMRSEWAQEQDDAASDAREQFQRHQSFRDWLIAAMHAGDRLAITVVEQRFAARDPNADTSIGTGYHPLGVDGTITAGTDFVISRAKAGAVTVLPMSQIAWVSNRRI